MAFSQDDLDKVKAAIVQGAAVVKVKHGDKEVTYRGLAEMVQAKEMIERELGIQPKTRRLYAKTSKGLD
jgi:hypothetical protein